MQVTILCDASRCHQTGASGYGYWIACSRGKRPGGAMLKKGRPVVGAMEAEMMAVVNSIDVAIRADLLRPGDGLLIQTDCTEAIRHLHGPKPSIMSKEALDCRTWFERQLRKLNPQPLELRHVKGHSKRKEARFLANRYCDARAKQYMRLARDRINGKMEAYNG